MTAFILERPASVPSVTTLVSNSLGMAIKRQRLARRLSRLDLARRLGVSYFTVAQWELGNYAPSAHHRLVLYLLFGDRTLDPRMQEAA